MGNVALTYLGSLRRWLSSSIKGKKFQSQAVGTHENTSSAGKKKLQLSNENRMSKEETNDVSDIQPLLPPEIIFEILSWLPVKYLLRMRCVCKSWHDLMKDRSFIEKHMNRGAPVSSCNRVRPADDPITASSVQFIYGSDGLILRRRIVTRKYYIINPATKQTLDIPNPHENRFGITLSFVPSIGQYKLVSFYDDSSKQGGFRESCEILTAGIDNSWRPLRMPMFGNVNDQHSRILDVVAAGGVVHCIRISKTGSNICLQIISLDLESESFMNGSIPKDSLFPYGSQVWPLNWNGKLAFAYRVEKDLNVLILENYKKLKWAEEKIVVPLEFEESEAISLNNLVPLSARSGALWFCLEDRMVFSYDIASRKLIHKFVPQEGCQISRGVIYVGTNSLVTLRGMRQPCVENLQKRSSKRSRGRYQFWWINI